MSVLQLQTKEGKKTSIDNPTSMFQLLESTVYGPMSPFKGVLSREPRAFLGAPRKQPRPHWEAASPASATCLASGSLRLRGGFPQVMLYCNLPYYTMLCYARLYYTILYYTILYYTILYYTILYYTILYYTILYYTILYYTMPL